MRAIIAKYKMPRTMKKALFIRNGAINENIAIQIDKTFKLSDATEILEKINAGKF